MKFKIADIRSDYSKEKLDIGSMEKDPIVQLDHWLEEAIEADLPEPTAMCLSTVDPDGQPSSRMVLLKGIQNGKLQFYTNYNSQKSRELKLNPKCAISIYWPHFERQINILGSVTKAAPETSDHYFHSRPWKSQVGAWASPQSEPISSRKVIMLNFAKYTAKYLGQKVPRPPHWGGFVVEPVVFNFWQGRPNRLHDRIKYSRQSSGDWKMERIAP
ncbi:MAG: pyridoxamine 5'-phosphate oxidase [Cyclobacteriaceae bacterium]|nr:pyridoxamine 5'-phosphate oxidase [Cyclobacteriaceae bacterium]